MKRRRFIQSIPLLYASPALYTQSVAYAQNIAKIETASPGAVGEPVARFFSAAQLAALRRLSDIILPRIADAPGALDAGAPEFLDFLVGQSPIPTQTLYRNGLDALNTRATAKYAKAFAALDNTQADELLSPLRKPWTWQAHGGELACSTCASTLMPADRFAAFLQHAKADVLTATTNSREWITAAQRTRGGGGNGTYWLPAE
jgi:hypothetical protein